MEKTTVYLPTELHHAVAAVARQTGQPQSEVIRQALRAYLAQHARPALSSIGSGENADLHASDTEDWLEVHFRPL